MRQRPKPSQNRKQNEGGKLIPALLCNVLGTLLILSVIAMMLPSLVPQLMGYRVYNVVSGSMEPAIPVGSMIFVRPTEAEEIREGDVIAFYRHGVVVTHRVLDNKKISQQFVTKGDANELADMESIAYADLLGRVDHHIPMLGDITAHITTPIGKIYLFAIILCGLLFNILASRLRDA